MLEPNMTIVLGDSGDARLTVGGEVDASNADELRRAIVAAARTQSEEVDVNLAGVNFMDSTGVRALAAAAAELRASGLGMVLCNVPRQVQRMLDIIDTGRSLQVRG
jgi:anti-anti-sigma factor